MRRAAGPRACGAVPRAAQPGPRRFPAAVRAAAAGARHARHGRHDPHDRRAGRAGASVGALGAAAFGGPEGEERRRGASSSVSVVAGDRLGGGAAERVEVTCCRLGHQRGRPQLIFVASTGPTGEPAAPATVVLGRSCCSAAGAAGPATRRAASKGTASTTAPARGSPLAAKRSRGRCGAREGAVEGRPWRRPASSAGGGLPTGGPGWGARGATESRRRRTRRRGPSRRRRATVARTDGGREVIELMAPRRRAAGHGCRRPRGPAIRPARGFGSQPP